MNVTIETQDNLTVVRPAGRLDFGAAAGFQQEIDRAMAGTDGAPKGLVVDCDQLEYVSSAGLRVFLVGARAAKAAGMAFAVCNLQPTVREVFGVSGFDRIISISDSLADALQQAASAK